MANTTWNPADKGSAVTLTNSNLTATGGALINQGVRGVDRQAFGKFYVEHTMTAWGSSTSIGFGDGTISVANATVPSIRAVFVLASGSIQCGGLQLATLGTRANGNIIGIAIDLDKRLAWFRVAPAGTWNGNANADPATSAGGCDISMGGGHGIALYPLVAFNVNAHSVTSNFGDSAFSGVVPTGYTAGFTAGAVLPNNALFTEAGVEEWYTQAATLGEQGIITQVGMEMWASASNVIPSQGIITQVGLEMWVRLTPPGVEARAMILA